MQAYAQHNLDDQLAIAPSARACRPAAHIYGTALVNDPWLPAITLLTATRRDARAADSHFAGG